MTATSSQPNGSADAERSGEDSRRKEPPTLLEWTARLVGLTLALAFFGYLLVNAFSDPAPPGFEISLQANEAEQVGGKWRTPVKIKNVGGKGATELKVSGVLADSQTQISFVIAYIGPGETKEVTLFLDADPQASPPQLSVASHQ